MASFWLQWLHDRSWAEFGLLLVNWFMFLSNLYQLVISLTGWKAARVYPPAREFRRLAVLIAAHNEERVVGHLIDSLHQQTYPAYRFDIYVSCDNCTDRTVDVVRAHGAIALIRRDLTRRGKTWNVRWALEQIDLDGYYGVVMFDADNLVDPHFLARINDQCEAHGQVDAIQGYLDAKNPDDTWVTRSYAITYWYANRFWERARANLGLSAYLGGTGLMVSTDCIRRVGWDPESLTEDLEFSAKLILHGGKVLWNEHAVVYDEKPMTGSASQKQRTRWVQGHLWVMARYAPQTLKKLLTTGRFQYLELLHYLISPGRSLIAYLFLVWGLGVMAYHFLTAPTLYLLDFSWLTGLAILLVQALYVTVVSPSLRAGRLTFKYAWSAVEYFLFGYTWIPVHFKAALLARDQKRWVKTEHNRDMTLDEVTRDPLRVATYSKTSR